MSICFQQLPHEQACKHCLILLTSSPIIFHLFEWFIYFIHFLKTFLFSLTFYIPMCWRSQRKFLSFNRGPVVSNSRPRGPEAFSWLMSLCFSTPGFNISSSCVECDCILVRQFCHLIKVWKDEGLMNFCFWNSTIFHEAIQNQSNKALPTVSLWLNRLNTKHSSDIGYLCYVLWEFGE